jgi:hypothetical protein
MMARLIILVRQYFHMPSAAYQVMPKDQYQHNAYLISKDEDPLTTFQSLLNRHIMLSYITDAREKRLQQNSAIILVRMFDMARREQQLVNTFKTIYFGWVMELAITRALKGRERIYQILGGQNIQVKDGVGSSSIEKQIQEENTIIDRLLKKNKNNLSQ